MSLTTRILLGLLAGLGLGAALAAFAPAAVDPAATIAGPIGGVWLDALRMTIVPLVFSLVFNGVAEAAGTVAAGGRAARALIWFAVLLLTTATFGAFAALGLLEIFPGPATDTLREGALGVTEQVPAPPSVAEMLRTFVPTNPIASAAEAAITPMVVFAFLFGLAATRIEGRLRDQLTGLFRATSESMLVIVGWVLWIAPLGVFALALVVGARVGIGAAGALAHYVLLVSAVLILMTLLVYPLVMVFGRQKLVPLVRALIPPQVVAISTQSSLATLPAMIEAADKLGVDARARGLVLPLAVSLFRATSPCGNMAVAMYVAHVFGVELTLPQIFAGIAVAALVSVGAVGVASAVTFFALLGPICMVMGLPLQLLPLLLAVETIPDIFRTVGNVTADVGVTRIVARHGEEADATETEATLP